MKDFHVKVIGDEPKADLAKERPEDCPLIAIKDDCEDAISRQAMLDYQQYLHDKIIIEADTESEMVEYMDRERFREVVHRNIAGGDSFDQLIDMQPTADVKSIVHAHWIEGQTGNPKMHNILCSHCFEGYPSKGHANSQYTKKKFKWCPHCGAKMA